MNLLKSLVFAFETNMEPGPSEGNCQPASPVVPSTPKAAPTLGTTPSPIGQPLAEVSQSPPLMGYPMQAGNVCYYPYKHSIHPPLPYMPGFGAHTAHAIPPGFMAYTTHPILAVEKQKTQSGVQGVYPGLFFNVPGHMINAVSPSHALNIVVPLSTTNGSGVLSSPPSAKCVDIEDYFLFAHVDPTDLVI